jgi:hypothetical protein
MGIMTNYGAPCERERAEGSFQFRGEKFFNQQKKNGKMIKQTGYKEVLRER